MQVKRQDREWLMRWTTGAGTASAASYIVAPEELCARCDDGGMWIAVPDLRPMPRPSLTYDCDRCGTTTAHAKLRLKSRSIGD